MSPLLAKGGGRKPFVQGWTHTSRRVRRFFQKPGGRRDSYAPFGHIGRLTSSAAAASALEGGNVYFRMVWSRDWRPDRAKRWLPAVVESRIFQGWEGCMEVMVRCGRSMLKPRR